MENGPFSLMIHLIHKGDSQTLKLPEGRAVTIFHSPAVQSVHRGRPKNGIMIVLDCSGRLPPGKHIEQTMAN